VVLLYVCCNALRNNGVSGVVITNCADVRWHGAMLFRCFEVVVIE